MSINISKASPSHSNVIRYVQSQSARYQFAALKWMPCLYIHVRKAIYCISQHAVRNGEYMRKSHGKWEPLHIKTVENTKFQASQNYDSEKKEKRRNSITVTLAEKHMFYPFYVHCRTYLCQIHCVWLRYSCAVDSVFVYIRCLLLFFVCLPSTRTKARCAFTYCVCGTFLAAFNEPVEKKEFSLSVSSSTANNTSNNDDNFSVVVS